MEHNICGWFEIPVTDMDRAINFYEGVLGTNLSRNTLENVDMAWFPHVPEAYGSGGALVCNPEFYAPSAEGSLIYLTTGTGDLIKDQERVEKFGGRMLIPRKQISEEHGFMMIFIDSEGNRVALHSNT
jgi:predicted enzyme related to lactoylglutathione lyase